MKYEILSGPHAHSGDSTPRLMGAVLLALAPATAFALWLFGWHAAFMWAACCVGALVGETACLALAGRSLRATGDGSALLTGWLLALSLPPSCPPAIAAFGGLVAVGLAKQVYGGLGHNLFNPAMAARVLLLICFPVQMTQWQAPLAQAGAILGSDGITSATPLGHDAPVITLWHLWIGNHAGSMGETSGLLLTVGGLVLIARRLIAWDTPLAVLLGAGVPSLIGWLVAPAHFANPLVTWCSGGLLLCAFFIATDPVTSPVTRAGRFLFGAGIGLMTWLIRNFGNTPEGVAFAVVLFNAATPLIDTWLKPQPFGTRSLGVKS